MIHFDYLPAADDLAGAIQTLRSLLLFYPSDTDSLGNLQFYYETLGEDKESQDKDKQPAQVTCLRVKAAVILWILILLNIYRQLCRG